MRAQHEANIDGMAIILAMWLSGYTREAALSTACELARRDLGDDGIRMLDDEIAALLPVVNPGVH